MVLIPLFLNEFMCSIPIMQVFGGAVRGLGGRESHRKCYEDTINMKVGYNGRSS